MRFVVVFILLFQISTANPWGFFAHKEINYLACFTLPNEMFGFYKQHIDLIKELATKADQRRYAIDEEAPRHYIDLDFYEISVPLDTVPKKWSTAVEQFGNRVLNEHGIVPWHIMLMTNRLTKAMQEKNYNKIIKYSADIGHYISDAHVPLHTTSNYNGQFTNQKGIHGLWESRLPEVFSTNYDFFTGKAVYLDRPLETIWTAVEESYAAKDSVLLIEQQLTKELSRIKYSFETKGKTTQRVYSREFSKAYHLALNNMVERRMKKAVYTIGCFWYTAWVNAGQPELDYKQVSHSKLRNEIDSLKVLIRGRKIKGRMESH